MLAGPATTISASLCPALSTDTRCEWLTCLSAMRKALPLFRARAVVAIAGAEVTPKINGEGQQRNESFAVRADDRLTFDFMKAGARTYIAVAIDELQPLPTRLATDEELLRIHTPSVAVKTGFLWHEYFAWHSTGVASGNLPAGGFVEPGVHFENPQTKRRLRNLLEVSGLLTLEPIRKVWIHHEAFAASRPSMMRDHGKANERRGGCRLALDVASQTAVALPSEGPLDIGATSGRHHHGLEQAVCMTTLNRPGVPLVTLDFLPAERSSQHPPFAPFAVCASKWLVGSALCRPAHAPFVARHP